MTKPSSPASRLPHSLTPFFGRATELAEILALLPTTRLLTLTGAGGSGKTRLAIEVGRHCLRGAPNSIRWVDLAPLVSGDLITEHVAAQLQVQERPDHTAVDALVDALEGVRWLVLDNCEHVVEAAAPLVETLLQRCGRLQVLATSREALGIDGERVWLLRGFATEGAESSRGHSEALQFFVDRAHAIKQSFHLSTTNSAAIEQICRRLDGMPLALELAAARIPVLTPQQISARLDDAFRLLTAGRRTALPRHRTLGAAVEWSYRLITPSEQELLQRLSVFAGPFSIEAAEHVCSGADLPRSIVLDVLANLVKRSLVNVHDEHGTTRYSLLEIIRQFASEQLATGNRASALAERHAAFYAGLVERAIPFLLEYHSQVWLEELTGSYADIRAALHWAYRGGERRVGDRIFGVLWWYWRMLWQLSEWRFWLDEALSHPDPDGRVLNAAGTFYYLAGNFERAGPLLKRAADALAREGDRVYESMAHSSLSHLLWNDNQLAAAREHGERAASIARTLDEAWPLCHAMSNGLGQVHVKLGELDAADACFREAYAKADRPGKSWGMASVARSRATLALDRGRVDEATEHVLVALTGVRRIRDPHAMFRVAVVLARVLVMRVEQNAAARLMGTMAAAIEAGMPLLRHERADLERLTEALQRSLGETRLEACRAEGRADSIEDALARGHEWLLRSVESTGGEAAPRAATNLRVRALGRVEVAVNGQPRLATGRQAKVVELLVYLLSHPEGRTREQIGVAFWPDASAAQVKNNFHVLLHKLRKSLGDDEIVVSEGEQYRVGGRVAASFDAADFEDALTSAPRKPARFTDAAALESALALYRGDFMAGENVGEWGLEVRERLRGLYVEGLSALADAKIAAGDPADAAATLELLIQADDLREEAYRRLIKCLDAAGQREQALRHYRKLVARLRSELDVEPARDTRALAERLQSAPSG